MIRGTGGLATRPRMADDVSSGGSRKNTENIRKSGRISVDAEVTLRRAGQHHYRVHAYDLSPLGCKLEFVERPQADERVWVKFDGMEALEGHVCWTEGFVVGIEFIRPMYPAVFDALVQRLR
jgi:hypothetical protein